MRDGYIEDFISGTEVKGTPEEVQAVQPLSKILTVYDEKLVVEFKSGLQIEVEA